MSSTLRLLSWNLDGPNLRYLGLRMAMAGTEILQRGADCVLLQEVTAQTLPALRHRLERAGYALVLPPQPRSSYHCLLAVRGDVQAEGYMPFPGSQMGRGLLWAEVAWAGERLLVMTSHLESLRHSSAERVRQLAIVAARLAAHRGPAIFAGDTNLRSAEARQVAVIDLWEQLGRPEASRHTWDMVRIANRRRGRARMRFDRVFRNDWPGWSGTALALVGTTPLGAVADGMHPSDHFGLLAVMELS